MLSDVIQTSEMERGQTVSSAASASDATPVAKAPSPEVHKLSELFYTILVLTGSAERCFLAPAPFRNMSETGDDAERTEQIETV